VLVAKDDSNGVVFKFAGADEAATDSLLAGPRHAVLLGVGIKRRDGVLHDDVFADPVLQCFGCARVDIVLRGIARISAPFFNGDEIMRIGGVVVVLHSGRNLVVRLGQDAFERNSLRIVAKRLEGQNLGHLVSVSRGVLCWATSSLFYVK